MRMMERFYMIEVFAYHKVDAMPEMCEVLSGNLLSSIACC